MQFNPITKSLYTDKGELIKKMHCPYRMTWETLMDDKSENTKICDKCNNKIYDAAYLTDDEALNMVKHNPSTCFKLNDKQVNLKKAPAYE